MLERGLPPATSGSDGPASDILVGHDLRDDAAVVRPVGDGRGLVLTCDVITPIVDDPHMFGRIAAANALSDVYAMGGVPRHALNLVFFPDKLLPLHVLEAVLAGAGEACTEAGVAVVGGHSVRDREIKFGLSVTGEVCLDHVWANNRGRAGQVLVLTKPLGTGLVAGARKRHAAGEVPEVVGGEDLAVATQSMATLNRVARNVAAEFPVTAATDVTGFGLLGHLGNIAAGSQLRARVFLAALPALPGALGA
ncbi:MAG: selenide, water dikinase SelD, partial [Nannocystaceae bacterium]